MWFVQTETELLNFSMLSSQDFMVEHLKSKYPSARVYKTIDECHNEFNALAFAQEWVDGDATTQTVVKLDADGKPEVDQDGNPVTEVITTQGPKKVRSVENIHQIKDNKVIVSSKDGEELQSWLLELVYAPDSE